jgi:hypothetical protein
MAADHHRGGFAVNTRRHLSAGQKAMIRLDIAPHLEAAAKQRQLAGLKKGNKKPVVLDRGQRQAKGKRKPRSPRSPGGATWLSPGIWQRQKA